MISDFHLHTAFSGDSETDPRLQIEQALALGMKEICVTDHHDYDTSFSEIDFTLDIPAYLETMKALRLEYRDRLRINIGMELGLQNHLKAYLENLERRYGDSLDFIIGSSHFAWEKDPYNPDFWEGRQESDAIRSFLELSLERIQTLSPCFDVYGHLDYVMRYAPRQDYRYDDFMELIEEMLRALIRCGKGLECNTAGFRYGLGYPNPRPQVLTLYRQLGGEILTVGSDGHTPGSLGHEFNRCQELLKSCGFRYYTVFHGRKPEFVPL